MRTIILEIKDKPSTNLEWLDAERPKTRSECQNGPRPCPWVMCRHHLYLEVNTKTGRIRLNHPSKELWNLEQTCSLDVADKGSHTLTEIGHVFRFSRQRVQQLENLGLRALKERLGLRNINGD